MVEIGLYSPASFGRVVRKAHAAPQRHDRADRASADRPATERTMDRHIVDAAETERLNALLVSVGRDRDRQAFVALFHHFAPRLKSYLQRLGVDAGGADEIVQEVMVSVWRRADSYDPALSAAGTWIYTIARNRRIDVLRRERRPEIDPDDPALVPDPVDPADRAVELEQDSERLHRAIRTLPPEQADLLKMAFFEDKPHSVIAAERNLPLGTVKSRLRLALARLRKAMGEET